MRRPVQLNLFVTDRCNARCGHCFNWGALNRGADLLPSHRLADLSRELAGPAALNLSGGEPFLFAGLGELVGLFTARGTRQVFIPTNGLLPERTRSEVAELLRRDGAPRVVVSLSLDGTEDVHDRIRGVPGGFRRLIETYEELSRLKAAPHGARLTLRVGTVLCNLNVEGVPELISWVRREMPAVDFHNFEILRGRPPDAALAPPSLAELERVRPHVFAAWSGGAFFGRGRRTLSWLALAVKRYVFTLHVETLRRERQLVPCLAGRTSVVVDEEGGLSFCELREKIGSLRDASFGELWRSPRAEAIRTSIAHGECHCIQSCFQQRNVVESPRVWPRVALYAATGRFTVPARPSVARAREPEADVVVPGAGRVGEAVRGTAEPQV